MDATRGRARILPRDRGAAPLDVVIGIMAFLAALALGAVLLAERSAVGWRQGLADRLTVQIVPSSADDAAALEREAGAALAVLRATRGIAHAALLSSGETAALVEPWLGKNAIIPELPVPRLIDATVVPGTPIDLSGLARRMKQAAPHALLDDHRRWIGRLQGLADTVTFSAYGILLLIAVAMAATVSFATRAGLEAHHGKVELLHQMGAQSGFIAHAFERHYLLSAFFAGLAGAGLASIFFVITGGLELVGVEPVPFLPPLALKGDELAWLLAVPVAAATIALVTARVSVLAALRGIY
jgi:cell division transport system permease protein